jgi:hypothetical protein
MGLIAGISFNEKFENLYPFYFDTTNPKYILIDNMYVASFLVVNYNKEMDGGFLDKILSLGIDFNLSIYYEKQNSNEIIKKITYQLGNTGADIKDSNENQMDIDVMSRVYNDAKYIRKQMQLEDEEFYYLYIYISIYSNSIKKLENNMRRIENVANSIGLTLLKANYKQEECFITTLPLLKNNRLLKKIAARNVLTDGISSTYPFLSNELCDDDGIFLGVNDHNNSLVIIDRFNSEKYKNANMFVIRY